MALPAGVSTATVTVGVPVTFSGGAVKSTITITPSVLLVHTATGHPLVNMVEETNTTEGVAAQFTLPHTDQAGFQDEAGNAYQNWYYTATIQYQSGKVTKPAFTKVFQLAVGQTTVDLDLLPSGSPAMPYTAPVATVTSVASKTGAVTALDVINDPAAVTALNATILDQISIDRGLTAAAGALSIPTYDDIANTGHPSVVEIPAGFGGYRFWMAHTPYPDGNRENPSILASHNGIDWELPAGAPDPVTPRSEIIPVYAPSYAYGSDTHLIYHQSKLWMYYRLATNAAKNSIWLKTSTDGITWTAQVKVLEDLTLETSLNSPAVEVEADGTFTMWCANATTTPPTVTRRTSPDGLAWSAPANCVLPAGALVWHLDVKRVGATYYCLVNSIEAKQGDRLYIFTSTDGITWTGDVKLAAIETDGGTFPTERFYRSALLPRVGTPVKWDVYTTMIGTVGGAETWRLGLLRDSVLPTPKQAALGTALAQDRTDAMFGIGRWVAGDSFARADSATSLGNATTGQTWTVLSGTPGIIGRRAYSAAGSARAYIETGAADVEVAFDLDALEESWLLFRATDSSNWLRAGVENNTGRFHIQKFVAGALTSIHAGGSAYGSDLQARKGDRIRVVVKGDLISLYRNTRLVKTLTESFNSTATKHGMSLATVSRVKAFGLGTL